jgi:hypothetical protein
MLMWKLELRLRLACLRGEHVALCQPRAEVLPGSAVEVGDKRGVRGDHALGDNLAREVGEALRDAAR